MSEQKPEQEHTLYSKRKSFSKNRKFDRAFLEEFRKALAAGGFTSVSIKLPHNLIKDGKDELSYSDFLQRERNYPSVIVAAKNKKTNEEVKVLFVNISTKAFFQDNTFPSGHSESPELYILSKPEHLNGLFDFYYSFLKNRSPITAGVQALIGVISLLVIIFYTVSLLRGSAAILHEEYGLNSIVDLVLFTLAIFSFLQFSNQHTGLYIKEKEFKPADLVRRAINGEFRDNPIVTIIVTILATLIVTLILKAFSI